MIVSDFTSELKTFRKALRLLHPHPVNKLSIFSGNFLNVECDREEREICENYIRQLEGKRKITTYEINSLKDVGNAITRRKNLGLFKRAKVTKPIVKEWVEALENPFKLTVYGTTYYTDIVIEEFTDIECVVASAKLLHKYIINEEISDISIKVECYHRYHFSDFVDIQLKEIDLSNLGGLIRNRYYVEFLQGDSWC